MIRRLVLLLALSILQPRDERGFPIEKIRLQWLWTHHLRADRWSLSARPGYLRLIASKPVASGGFLRAPNAFC